MRQKRRSEPKKTAKVKQLAFLNHLAAKGTRFNVSEACRKAVVSRAQVYRWLATDKKFKAAYDEVQESRFDLIEATLHGKAVNEKDTTALIFLCKTLLKNRGYVEGGRVTVTDTGPILARVIDDLLSGNTTIDRAALELTRAGVALPETLKIMLAKQTTSESEEYGDGPTEAELDRRYHEAIAKVEQQRQVFVPERQAEVAAMKEEMRDVGSWRDVNIELPKGEDHEKQ